MKLLSKNKYVTKVSSKAITYSFEFKKRFIEEYNKVKLPRVIFEEAGFNIEILGMKRVETARKRWRKAFKDSGELGLKYSRKGRCLNKLEKFKAIQYNL